MKRVRSSNLKDFSAENEQMREKVSKREIEPKKPQNMTPLQFRNFLPEIWDHIFTFGWWSEFKSLLLVSHYFSHLLHRHLKHLDFSGEIPRKSLLKILNRFPLDSLCTLQITSYGTLHIDPLPEKLKLILKNCDFRSLTSLAIQRWSLIPEDISFNRFPNLTHLTLISTGNTEFSHMDVGLHKFSKLKSLTLRFVSEPLLKAIQGLTGLVSLNVGNLSEIRAVNNETIEYTSKNGREISDSTFHYILNFTSLMDLNLSGLSITDKSLEKLTTLKDLKRLSLTWCQRITDVGLGHLTKLRNLTELETWHSGISSEGVRKYLEYWKKKEEEEKERMEGKGEGEERMEGKVEGVERRVLVHSVNRRYDL